MKPMKIFISHISEEQALALVIKGWLNSVFLGKVKAFVSGDPDDIPAGTKWLDKISAYMECSDLLIILYSHESKTRPWINFEAGCGWIKDIPIIPICHSGLNVSQLESPISDFQGLDIESTDFTKRFFSAVAKFTEFEQAPRVSSKEFMREVKTAIGSWGHKVIENVPSKKKNELSEKQITPTTPSSEVSSKKTSELSEEQMEIMHCLIKERDSGGYSINNIIYGMGGVKESSLASRFNMRRSMLSFHMDFLIKQKYVDQKADILDLLYSISQEGIKYMVDNGFYDGSATDEKV